MVKKRVKATLSFDGEIYKNFQKYCEENVIMVSGAIEKFMDDFYKKKKSKFSLVLFFLGLFIMVGATVDASVFADLNQGNFDNGAYYSTFYNSTLGAVQLTAGYLNGNFTSRIFNAGSSAGWNNISWIQGGKYGHEYPNNTGNENIFGGINMAGNVILYHLNELSGTFFDSSGNQNNGTLAGSMTRDGEGKFSSIAIDAKGSNGRISASSTSPSLSFNETITLEAWIKWTGESGENFNLQNVITAGNFRRALRVTEPDHFIGGSQVLSYFNIGGVDVDMYSNTKVAVGSWTHIATTYNGSELRIYINGKLDTYNSTLSGNITGNNDNIYVGAESGSISNFDGLIDEVAIYNRSLDADEILRRYERGAVMLNLSVKSCDDSACSGESYIAINNNASQQLNLSNNSYFQYLFTFNSENVSASPTLFNVSIDYSVSNTAPNISIIYPLNGSIFNYNVSIPLNFSAIDNDGNLQTCWYSLNSGQINFTLNNCTNSTFNTSNGIKTLYLYANDSAGMTGSSLVSFSVDIIVPVINITYPFNTNYSNIENRLNYTVSDANLQSCWYSLDGGVINTSVNCGTNITGLNSNQGVNTWRVYANDSAGNLNYSAETFFVDSIRPEVLFGTGTENNGSSFPRNWIFTNVSVIETNEANITFTLRNFTSLVNSTTFTNGNRIINWTNLPDGIYYYNVSIRDTLNNYNSTEIRTLTLDNNKPGIQFVSPTENNHINISRNYIVVNVSASDGTLLNGVVIRLYNSSNGEINSTSSLAGNLYYNFSGLTDGIYYFNASANDSAGNINNTETREITIDLTVPQINFGSNTDTSGVIVSRNWIFTNVSVIETNEANITFTLRNFTSLVNSTTFTNGNRIINWTNLPDGIYYYNVSIRDYSGNMNYTETRNITLDRVAPSLIVLNPQNMNYSNSTILVNISGNGENIWFFNGTGNSTYTSATYVVFTQGGNQLIAYANDSAGNINLSSVSFNVDSVGPSITIVKPNSGSTFGTNVSLALNFSVNDSNLQSCWYNIDNGANRTLTGCLNSTFNTSEGSHVVFLFANDSYGNFGMTNSSFSIQVGAPTVSLVSPVGEYLGENEELEFVYEASDLDLGSCGLWGNFNGIFSLNQTDNSVTSGSENSFFLNLSDGDYIWSVSCNDSFGHVSITSNESFHIDTISPNATLNSPLGSYSTRNNLPISFSVNDTSPTMCYYRVYRGSNIEIPNTLVNCATGSSNFSVTLDADFVFSFFVEDPVGHIYSTNSSFTVSTTGGGTPGGTPGGGGGGGGGSTGVLKPANASQLVKLNLEFLDEIILKKGTSGKANLQIINTGNVFLNGCKLKFNGGVSSWLSNGQTKGLGEGEKFVYSIEVKVPDEGEPGEYLSEVIIECDEGNYSIPMIVNAYRNSFEGEIGEYERNGGNLKVNYNLKEYSGEDHDILINYEMRDLDNITRYKGQSNTKLLKKEDRNENIEFKLPKDSFGEFVLIFEFGDGFSLISKEKKIFLPSSTGGTGLAISGGGGKKSGVVLIFILSLALLFFVIRFLHVHHKKVGKVGKLGKKDEKKFIKLDV